MREVQPHAQYSRTHTLLRTRVRALEHSCARACARAHMRAASFARQYAQTPSRAERAHSALALTHTRQVPHTVTNVRSRAHTHPQRLHACTCSRPSQWARA
eukprot:6174570-Pleurochrysis_carterae.AAC.1